MPARKKKTKSRARPALTRERIVKTALSLADRGGVESLSMRRVAAKLGVEAMSLYRYVSGKDDLLQGVADRVLSQIETPAPGAPWREAMRRRAASVREVLLRHPFAAVVVESCATMTPTRLGYTDAVLGALMADGFDATSAYRAFLVLDSYVYGFTLQEQSWPRSKSSEALPTSLATPPAQFPHFAAVMGAVMSRVGAKGLTQSYADEFHVGLELVLDGLEPLRGSPRRAGSGARSAENDSKRARRR